MFSVSVSINDKVRGNKMKVGQNYFQIIQYRYTIRLIKSQKNKQDFELQVKHSPNFYSEDSRSFEDFRAKKKKSDMIKLVPQEKESGNTIQNGSRINSKTILTSRQTKKSQIQGVSEKNDDCQDPGRLLMGPAQHGLGNRERRISKNYFGVSSVADRTIYP